MTNNNDFVEWKGLKQVVGIVQLVIFIMVRHNHYIHTYRYVRRLCEVKILFMIESIDINQKR